MGICIQCKQFALVTHCCFLAILTRISNHCIVFGFPILDYSSPGAEWPRQLMNRFHGISTASSRCHRFLSTSPFDVPLIYSLHNNLTMSKMKRFQIQFNSVIPFIGATKLLRLLHSFPYKRQRSQLHDSIAHHPVKPPKRDYRN